MSQIIRFETNVPQVVALKWEDGKNVEGQYGPQVFYSCEGDRSMYVAPIVADKIAALGTRKGEPISICKREVKNGRSKATIQWEVLRAEDAGPALSTPASAGSSRTATEQHSNGNTTFEQRVREAFAPAPVAAPAPKPAAVTGSAPGWLQATGCAAVDAIIAVERYAKSQGLEIAFGEEDVRAVWISAFIQQTRDGGSTWRH